MKEVSLSAKDIDLIRQILLGPYQPILFGSRVDRTNGKFSDVDICLKSDAKIEGYQLGEIKEAFDESDLPYVVDVVDYFDLPPSFQKTVDKKGVLLQECAPAKD